MIIIVTVYATDISIIKEIKGDVKNQQYEDTDLEHEGSWVRIPSGAQIFCVLVWLILYMSLSFLYNCNNNTIIMPRNLLVYCWFSHDVTKIQTKKLSG